MIEIGPNLYAAIQNIIGLTAGCITFLFVYKIFEVMGR